MAIDSSTADIKPTQTKATSLSPLREKVFRRIWLASILANVGQLILGVGVAWEMTRLTSSPSMVALVQTAMMLPIMLVALPAGAIADTYDRRKVAMLGLSIAILFCLLLTGLAFFDLLTPWLMLACCFLIGSGVALYYPAWQSSIGEQVAPHELPAAVALGTVSFNVARSFGPAIGGLIVLAAGAQASFAFSSLAYLPLILAFFVWQRGQIQSRLPPEGINRAIVSGLRFVFHSSAIRAVLIRVFLFGFAGATATAMAPLVAKNLLHGNAGTFGILLGASGVGAVSGVVLLNSLRDRLGIERSSRLLAVLGGGALILIGLSRAMALTCIGMFLAGAAAVLTISLYNIVVQTTVPRWVIGRALSLFTSATTGGIAVGAWFWGEVANQWNIETAIISSGLATLMIPIVALIIPVPESSDSSTETIPLVEEPEVELPITVRSGPIVIELEYRIDEKDTRGFYYALEEIRLVRLRNGGFNWSVTRDIGDPELWIERFHCPTWADYLHTRDRLTQTDIDAHLTLESFLIPGEKSKVRRGLERPFGSVRLRGDTPITHQDQGTYLPP